jgi:hypothetical protein
MSRRPPFQLSGVRASTGPSRPRCPERHTTRGPHPRRVEGSAGRLSPPASRQHRHRGPRLVWVLSGRVRISPCPRRTWRRWQTTEAARPMEQDGDHHALGLGAFSAGRTARPAGSAAPGVRDTIRRHQALADRIKDPRARDVLADGAVVRRTRQRAHPRVLRHHVRSAAPVRAHRAAFYSRTMPRHPRR